MANDLIQPVYVESQNSVRAFIISPPDRPSSLVHCVILYTHIYYTPYHNTANTTAIHAIMT